MSKYELFARQQNDLYNITEPKKIDGVKEQLTRIEGYFNDFDIEDIKKSKKIIEEIGDVKIRMKVLEEMYSKDAVKERVLHKLKKFYKYITTKQYKNI